MKYKIMVLLLCASLLLSCSNQGSSISDENDEGIENTDLNLNIKGLSDIVVEYDKNDFYSEWESENSIYIKLMDSSAESEGKGVKINQNVVTISSPGVYVVSGRLNDGQIIVDSDSGDAVRLILNNAEISCSDNAPIYVKNSGKTVISLPEGTENSVADGSSYSSDDADEPNAAIFSKDDLTINGTGSLTVNGNYNNGIFGKDIVKITGGTINITSVDDGLLGRDLLVARDCNITINSKDVGIKSTNDKDEDKGNIILENGSYVINSGGKGIKSESDITIIGGNYTINSADDSIHSNNSISISGGELNVSSGDDGIHGDSEINITGGTINVLKSYEGIESSIINISGGTIQIAASDDGINVSGGKDSSSVNGRTDQNSFEQSEDCTLNISGGNIYVDAAGDGLDANGSIFMSGGTVIVNGPVSNGDGAIDYDQKFEISGGLMIAAGSSGMAMAPSDNSSQNSVLIRYSHAQEAGTMVNISDSSNKSIITFTPKKDYQSILVSSPELKMNSTFQLYTGGACSGTVSSGLYLDGAYENGNKLCDFTVSKSVMSIDETGEEVEGGMGMQPGQMKPWDDGEGMQPGQEPRDGIQHGPKNPKGSGEDMNSAKPEPPEGFDKKNTLNQ